MILLELEGSQDNLRFSRSQERSIMNFDLNELILSITKANIELSDIFSVTIPPGGRALNGTTSLGVCGIVLPLKGKARFTINRCLLELEPGIILHAGSGIELDKEVLGSTEWKYILLHYKVSGDEKAKKYLESSNITFPIGLNKSLELEALLQKLLKLQEETGPMGGLKTKTMVYVFLERCFQFVRETTIDIKEENIEFILGYIKDNLDKSLSVSQLAEKIGMDSRQFHYLFLKRMGICPKKYLIQCKINHAKRLLEDENYSITRISGMVGYEDPLHFSRIFKKNTGISPSHYRNNFEKNPWRI